MLVARCRHVCVGLQLLIVCCIMLVEDVDI